MKSLVTFTYCLFITLAGFCQEQKEKKDSSDRVFTIAEVMPQFPGGDSAWTKFVADSLRYPVVALKKKIEGTVWVKFTVDTEGELAYIEAFSGPVDLWDEAERLLKISPHWIPAKQNGWLVKCYQKQKVIFKLK